MFSVRILTCVLGALFAFTAMSSDVQAAAKKETKKAHAKHGRDRSCSSSTSSSSGDCGCN